MELPVPRPDVCRVRAIRWFRDEHCTAVEVEEVNRRRLPDSVSFAAAQVASYCRSVLAELEVELHRRTRLPLVPCLHCLAGSSLLPVATAA